MMKYIFLPFSPKLNTNSNLSTFSNNRFLNNFKYNSGES